MVRKTGKYTGVGSRSSPPTICSLMTEISGKIREQGYILRTGGAKGADEAFMGGAGESLELFVPWGGFNGYPLKYMIPFEAFTLAECVMGASHWSHLTNGGKLFHARNILQVLGQSCKEPSDFVICWTPEGKITGGTATAIRLANAYKIPVYNLAIEGQKQIVLRELAIEENPLEGEI